MISKKLIRPALILLLLSLNIGCDQVSKNIVRHKLEYYDRLEFLNRHFSLQKVENTGAFLSLGDTLTGPLKTIILNIIPFIVLVYGLYFVFTKTTLDKLNLFAIIIILGGGFGNLYDRVVHGSVTDFMHIKFGFLQTGIFNVADMSIMAGMFIILIHSFLKKKEEEGKNVTTGEQV